MFCIFLPKKNLLKSAYMYMCKLGFVLTLLFYHSRFSPLYGTYAQTTTAIEDYLRLITNEVSRNMAHFFKIDCETRCPDSYYLY